MDLLTISAADKEQITTTMPFAVLNTTLSTTESVQEESLYILIPLGSLLAIIILSLLVYLMASNRKRGVHICCRKKQGRITLHAHNEYDSTLMQHTDAEEAKLGSEDNPTKSLLSERLQVNNRFANYLSTSQLNSPSELIT